MLTIWKVVYSIVKLLQIFFFEICKSCQVITIIRLVFYCNKKDRKKSLNDWILELQIVTWQKKEKKGIHEWTECSMYKVHYYISVYMCFFNTLRKQSR